MFLLIKSAVKWNQPGWDVAMNAWKSVKFGIGLVLALIFAGMLSITGAQPPAAPSDEQTQELRRLAAVHDDPALAQALEQSLVLIPAGDFIRGSQSGNFNEAPQARVYLDAFAIERYEVTNVQYARFLAASDGEPPSYWNEGAYPEGQADYPVVGISWKEAEAYCAWAGKRLPTEAEWEKACRGPDGNIYPWGNTWMPRHANVEISFTLPAVERGSDGAWVQAWKLLQSTPTADSPGLRPVGSSPSGASPYGVMDLAGNASEWVYDWYNWSDYSGMPAQNPVSPGPQWNHCVRGSAWYDPAGSLDQVAWASRCSYRSSAHASADPRLGFRCAQSRTANE